MLFVPSEEMNMNITAIIVTAIICLTVIIVSIIEYLKERED